MEKFKAFLSTVLIIGIVAIIGIGTFLKVSGRHQEKLLLVATSKIEESARKCVLEEKCSTGSTTLGNLISNGYLDKQVHPITKEFIKEDLVITCKNFECETHLD